MDLYSRYVNMPFCLLLGEFLLEGQRTLIISEAWESDME